MYFTYQFFKAQKFQTINVKVSGLYDTNIRTLKNTGNFFIGIKF